MERSVMPRLLIAAPHSGSGKTMFTMGLLAACKKRGIRLMSYKCGPDYIDPMFHSRVLNIPARNLDGYFANKETLRMLFAEGAEEKNAALSIIEGVMGYYDGAGLVSECGSSFELAQTLDAPAVLLIDAKGMSLSVLALLKGFLEYRTPSRIAGVVFNRMSGQVYEAIRPQAEAQLGIRAYGYIPQLPGMELPARHLGLVTPGELADLQNYVDMLAQKIEETVDVDGLLTLARSAPELVWEKRKLPRLSQKVNIAVARDEAFCFLYEDNLNYLKKIGAELHFFSPLHDNKLPEHTEVLLLPGGYPELYARKLSENEAMRASVLAVLKNGVYVLAECGGFLYLTRQLEDMEGNVYPMVGWILTDTFRTKILGRFGYVELAPQAGGASIRGHEFHYFDTTDNGSAFTAKKPFRDVQWACMHASGQELIGFPHLYYYSNPAFLAERLERYLSEKHTEKNACAGEVDFGRRERG